MLAKSRTLSETRRRNCERISSGTIRIADRRRETGGNQLLK